MQKRMVYKLECVKMILYIRRIAIIIIIIIIIKIKIVTIINV